MKTGKKLFLIDFSSGILVEVAKELKNKGAEILYWTGRKRNFEQVAQDKKTFPETIFHSNLDALKMILPDNQKLFKFEPPGADLIKEMLECESLVLTMMTRLDFRGQVSLLKKKHLYYKYLQYYNGLIKKLKPDMIIFRSVPHAAYNFVLYCLAKKYGIPAIMFDASVFNDRLLVLEDFRRMPEEFIELYNRIKGEQHLIEELPADKQAYFKKLSDPSVDASPSHKLQVVAQINDPIRTIPPLRKIWKNIKTCNFFPALRYNLKSIFNLTSRPIFTLDEDDKADYRNIYQLKRIKKITDKYKAEYEKLQQEIDWNKKYVYLPLHYQPECNTSPVAEHFADQILLAKILSAALPKDWIIYVKEHIAQWNYRNAQPHLFRHAGYYRELADLSNVRLIDPLISSYDLIVLAQAVAVASGTAGWEALARGKPVLFFGFPWYQYCDGAFYVNSVNVCREAIEKINNGYKPDAQRVLNYLIALDRTTIRASHVEYMERASKIPRGESVKNIAEAILSRFKN